MAEWPKTVEVRHWPNTELAEVVPADLAREQHQLLCEAREHLGMAWSDGEDPDDIAARVDAGIARYEREVGP